MSTQNKFGLTATRQIRFAVKADKWLEVEAQAIATMIAQWEHVADSRMELVNSLCETTLCPEAILITNKCINDVSLVLDEMWKEILEAQQSHVKNIKRVQAAVKAIKD